MKSLLGTILVATSVLAIARAGTSVYPEFTQDPAPAEDGWQASLVVPGFLAGLEGDVGLGGVISEVDVNAGDILRRIDMAAMIRGEIAKGNFGVTGEFIYLGLSDSVSSGGVVSSTRLQVDEAIGDLGLRRRVAEGERGFLDVIGGVRYVNIHQKIETEPDPTRVAAASQELVDEVGDRLRTGLSDSELGEMIDDGIGEDLQTFEGRDPVLPVAPLLQDRRRPILDRVRAIIDEKKAALKDALRDRAQAATAALRKEAQQRVDSIKSDMSKKIANTLNKRLDATASRTDDWFDPYVGLRGRYYFNDRFYAGGKCDVGGFGIGSDLTWQAEAALGYQITPAVFVEAGYRALSIDYDHRGFVYDTVTHGVQLTLGMNF